MDSMNINDVDIVAFCEGEGIRYVADKVELPFRAFWRGDDKASGSLNQNTRLWYDHGTGEGGNLYQYVEKSRRMRPSEAKAFVRKHYINKHIIANAIDPDFGKKVDDIWVPIVPVPEEWEHRIIGPEIHKMGRPPTAEYYYRNSEGALIGIVARWDRSDGGKVVLPFAFCQNRVTHRKEWRCKEFTKPFPLFGVQFLKDWKGPILIVEGEKCCVEAYNEIGKIILPMTWHGGANRVDDTDWSPLYNWPFEIMMWPDNDDAGMKAAFKIYEILKNGKN